MVTPAVIHQQLATTTEKWRQIWINCVVDPSIGFVGNVDVGGEIERVVVPFRILEDDVLKRLHRKWNRLGDRCRPEGLRSRHQRRENLDMCLRMDDRPVDGANGFNLIGGQARRLVAGPTLQYTRIK